MGCIADTMTFAGVLRKQINFGGVLGKRHFWGSHSKQHSKQVRLFGLHGKQVTVLWVTGHQTHIYYVYTANKLAISWLHGNRVMFLGVTWNTHHCWLGLYSEQVSYFVSSINTPTFFELDS